MFQFPRFASLHSVKITGLQPAGLSHSEISGSKVICTYPKLIAAYHVLHRLREPRHPPDALTCFRLRRAARAVLILSAVIEIFVHVNWLRRTQFLILTNVSLLHYLQSCVTICQRTMSFHHFTILQFHNCRQSSDRK